MSLKGWLVLHVQQVYCVQMAAWIHDHISHFNPFNRQMHEVSFVAGLEIEDYLITLSNSETLSSAVTKKPSDIHVFKQIEIL